MTIAVDIGGTWTRVASFIGRRSQKLRVFRKFATQRRYSVQLLHLSRIIQEFSQYRLQGIGVGLPAVLDSSRSIIRHCTNLPAWKGKPLAADLKRLFHSPVFLENDAVAGALGEAFYGYGVRRSFLYLSWGTGIGGAWVERVGKKMRALTMEPGHQILEWKGGRCACGQRGCWEYFCGGKEVQKRLGRPPGALPPIKKQEVLERFTQGLINLIAVRPCSLVILGGGIIAKKPSWVAAIKKIMRRSLFIFPVPSLKIAKRGEQSGLYGALALAQGLL